MRCTVIIHIRGGDAMHCHCTYTRRRCDALSLYIYEEAMRCTVIIQGIRWITTKVILIYRDRGKETHDSFRHAKTGAATHCQSKAKRSIII